MQRAEIGQPAPVERLAAGEAFSIEKRSDGVALVRIDVPGETMNTLQANFASEFERVFAELDSDSSLRAVVLTSGKPDNFIAGADVKMLRAVTTAEQAAELARTGQRALERIVDFRAPVVAAIHGPCLGGGLEVALACHARVASNDEKTKLGLPEVQLGLIPALGGTQRLPRLIGLEAALDLLLTGKQLDARRALRAGLVDEVVPQAILVDVAIELALKRASGRPSKANGGVLGGLKRLLDKDELKELALAENPLGRKVVFEQAKKRLLSKTQGNYPAPERILEVVKLGLSRGIQAGLGAEAHAFGELVVSAEAQALMSIFTATTELKKDPGYDGPRVEPKKVRQVGVLGAGLMGAGIAYVTTHNAKLPVRLRDRDHGAIGRGLRTVRELLDENVSRRRMTPQLRDLEMARITATTDYSGFKNAEVVIEAVFEDLSIKHQVLREIEQHGHKNAIFASNTSSIPIARIAQAAAHPERVIGMHYFSPVPKMPLLEVIVTPETAPWVIATVVDLGKRQGKTVIVVRDGVGFYTSRILGPYMNEASYLLAEGVPVEAIDRALAKWGFPVGPITLLDEVGIDVGAKVGKILHEAFGERMAPPPGVQKLLDDQRLGKKNGRGFYLYGPERKKGEKEVDKSVYGLLGVEPTADVPSTEIAQRCALQMINEAAHCFGEGIVRSARDGDIGAVFGLGFPPFRGGPFRYVDTVGAAEIVRRLEGYRTAHGLRFAPAPVLLDMAKSGGRFYPG